MTEKASPLPADIAALSFEDALGQLETIVRQLESGQIKLDEAMAAYERGAQLRQHCAGKLTEAQSKIERIAELADGRLTTQPAEIG